MKICAHAENQTVIFTGLNFEKLIGELRDSITDISFNEFQSQTQSLNPEYLKEAGIKFSSENGKIIFNSKDDVLHFLELDEIYSGSGSLTLSTNRFDFRIDKGNIIFSGEKTGRLLTLIFGIESLNEGQIIKKTGLFSDHYLVKENNQPEKYYTGKKPPLKEVLNKDRYYILHFLLMAALLIFNLAVIFFLLKKPLFIISIFVIEISLFFVNKFFQSKRLYREICQNLKNL